MLRASMRTLTTLSRDDARLALAAMQAELARRGTPAVVVVADAHGDPIALERTDDAPASSVRIAMNKAWTAASQGVPTRAIGERVRGAERLDIAYYGDQRICGWAGGLSVVVNGVVVGAVAVSGLPEDDDESVARVGLGALATV